MIYRLHLIPLFFTEETFGIAPDPWQVQN